MVKMSHLFLLRCHFVLLIFSPQDDPVEDISAELLNWKEAALIGCGGGGGHCFRLQADLLSAQLGGSVRGTGMVAERPRLDPPSQVAPSHLLFSCILTKITALSGTVTGGNNRMYCKTGVGAPGT